MFASLTDEAISQIRNESKLEIPDHWVPPGSVTELSNLQYYFIICNEPERVEHSLGILHQGQILFHRFRSRSFEEADVIGNHQAELKEQHIQLKTIHDSRLDRNENIHVVLALTWTMHIHKSN